MDDRAIVALRQHYPANIMLGVKSALQTFLHERLRPSWYQNAPPAIDCNHHNRNSNVHRLVSWVHCILFLLQCCALPVFPLSLDEASVQLVISRNLKSSCRPQIGKAPCCKSSIIQASQPSKFSDNVGMTDLASWKSGTCPWTKNCSHGGALHLLSASWGLESQASPFDEGHCLSVAKGF